MFFYEAITENSFWSDLLFDLGMTVGMIIPFCRLYFLNNSEYKRHYLKNLECGHSPDEIMREHVKSFAKYELWMLIAISLVLSLIPTVMLGKTGVSFLFASAGFFIGFLPDYIFHNSSFIVRLLVWLLWDGYIVGLYWICLKISCRIWEKNKLRKFGNED